jgi:hypothetical protein
VATAPQIQIVMATIGTWSWASEIKSGANRLLSAMASHRPPTATAAGSSPVEQLGGSGGEGVHLGVLESPLSCTWVIGCSVLPVQGHERPGVVPNLQRRIGTSPGVPRVISASLGVPTHL